MTGTGNVKPILKALAKIFAHSDKNVRAEGTALTTALYRYLGPALIPALADLKPVQMAELQKSFDAMDADGQGAGSGKPTRWTRKAQKEREAAEASGGGDEGSAEVEEESAPIDPLSLLEPVDVIAKFPPDLMDMLGSAKWKERLETLTECNKVLTAPGNARISDSNVDACGALVQTLGTKCKSDANVMVVMEAAKALEGLARGMGKAFGRYRGVVMSSMLERLKERKANVVEALGKALDAVFTTVRIESDQANSDNTRGYSRGCPPFSEIQKSPGQGRHPQIPTSLVTNHCRCTTQGSSQASCGDARGLIRRQRRASPVICCRMSRNDDEDPG